MALILDGLDHIIGAPINRRSTFNLVRLGGLLVSFFLGLCLQSEESLEILSAPVRVVIMAHLEGVLIFVPLDDGCITSQKVIDFVLEFINIVVILSVLSHPLSEFVHVFGLESAGNCN